MPFIILRDLFHCARRARTSFSVAPEPRATRRMRSCLSSVGSFFSSAVIESMMTRKRSRLVCISFFCLGVIPPRPNIPAGMCDMMRSTVPMRDIISICWSMSCRLKRPDISRSAMRWASSASRSSGARSISPWMSPIPSSREMNRSDSNNSRSPTFSPSPMNTIGAPVVATVESAPPPRAVPSSLVTMTPVMSTRSWKLAATGPAACPTCASMTRKRSVAFATLWMFLSSTCNSSSSRSRPAVSMMTRSASPTAAMPLRTMVSASFSSGSPYTVVGVSASSCCSWA